MNFLTSLAPFVGMFSGFAIIYFMLIKPLSKFDWESVERQLGVPRGTYENDPDVNIELRRKLKRLNKKKLKPCYN
jgi:hypothetical protein